MSSRHAWINDRAARLPAEPGRSDLRAWSASAPLSPSFGLAFSQPNPEGALWFLSDDVSVANWHLSGLPKDATFICAASQFNDFHAVLDSHQVISTSQWQNTTWSYHLMTRHGSFLNTQRGTNIRTFLPFYLAPYRRGLSLPGNYCWFKSTSSSLTVSFLAFSSICGHHVKFQIRRRHATKERKKNKQTMSHIKNCRWSI